MDNSSRFGRVYHNLQPRVTKTLLHAFMDPKRALTQHYGAVRGLAALGSRVVYNLQHRQHAIGIENLCIFGVIV